MFDLWQTIGIAVVVFAATFFQSATGFGFGMMAMAVLPLFLPFAAVSMGLPLLLIPMLAVNFAVRRRAFRLRQAVPLIVGVALGVAPGVYLLAKMDEGVLMRVLGVVLVASALFRLREGRGARPPATDEGGMPTSGGSRAWVGPSCGFAVGLLGGAFNAGGPPLIYYLYARPWPPQTIIATLQALFLLTALLKVAFSASSDILGGGAIGIALAGALPMALGTVLGIRLSSKLSGKWLRVCAFVFIGFIGLKLAVFG